MGENLDKWYKYLRNTSVILTMEQKHSSVIVFPWLPVPGNSSLSAILKVFHYEEIFITHFFYPYSYFVL